MNALKICLISFDNWHYDAFIIEALRKKNIDAYHIKLGAYKHASLTSRINNVFSKIILNKNPKHIKKQEYLLDQIKHHVVPKYDMLTVSSFDKRFPIFNKIAYQLKEHNLSYKFIFVSRIIRNKIFKYNLDKIIKLKIVELIEKSIKFQSKKIPLKKLLKLYSETKIIIGHVRDNQSGLSYRFFEAMGFQKKIITNNSIVKNYNFYNPNNILVIEDKIEFSAPFFKTGYTPVLDDIFNQYTLESSIVNVFKL
jgi:hypothetical protein